MHVDEDGLIATDRKLCTGCGACVEACYPSARKMSGRAYTSEEVFQEIAKDLIFYRNTGGGITISGGEATMFPEFCGKLLRQCRNSGIHTAIETCGYAPWDTLSRIICHTDMVLYDIKLIDTNKSLRWTGVNNLLILENAQRLAASGHPLTIRVPLVPGINDDKEEFCRILDFVESLKSTNIIHILPFHQLGLSKYEALDLEYRFQDSPEESIDRVTMCSALAIERRFQVSVGGSGVIQELPKNWKESQRQGFFYQF